jgi:protein gp37
MAENSGISWTDNTFNPWIGCTKVSPACDFCYAETWDNRFNGERWGPKATRTRTKIRNWNKVRKWDRLASEHGAKTIVFTASLADIFDNHKSILPEWRADFWSLVKETPNLAWMLLTKRPQNIMRYLPDDWGDGYSNVALGASAENQEEADRRIPVLMKVPAACRFLSMEPLLGPVNLPADALKKDGISYLIAGGESGSSARKTDPDWVRSVRDQASAAGIGFHFKQWGEWSAEGVRVGVDAAGNMLDGVSWLDRLPIAS